MMVLSRLGSRQVKQNVVDRIDKKMLLARNNNHGSRAEPWE